jgi:hypothetical protein
MNDKPSMSGEIIIEIGRTMDKEGHSVLTISKFTDKTFVSAYAYPVELVHPGKIKIPTLSFYNMLRQLEAEEAKHGAI